MATPLSSQFLITSAEVKELSGLNKNIEDRKITSWIMPAQMCLRSAIGKDGYDAIIATLTTPDADYDTLIDDYVKPYLAAQVERMTPIPMAAEADRNGSFEREGETYRPASLRMLGMMNATARDQAEIRRDMMLQYIYDERATFTWWSTSACGNQRTNYSGGVITRIDASQIPESMYPVDGYPVTGYQNECCE